MSKANWETRLALLFASVLLASLLFQILYVIPFIQSREELAARSQQQAVARSIAYELDATLNRILHCLDKIADQPAFRQMRIGDQPAAIDQIIGTSSSLTSLFVLNSGGWFVAGSASDITPYATQSYADRAFFADPFINGSVHFSAPRFYPQLELTATAIGVPLVSESAQRVGVLLGGMRLNELIDSVTNYPLPEGTVAFLVDKEGTVVAHSGIDLSSLAKGPLSLKMSDHPLVIAIMRGEKSAESEYDLQGTPYLGNYVLATNGWGMVVEAPMAVILANSNVLGKRLLTLNTALFGVALVFSLFFTQRITATRKQAERQIRQHNEEMAALNAIGMVMNRSLRLPKVLAALRRQMRDHIGIPSGAFFSYDQAEDRLALETSWGMPEEWSAAMKEIAMPECVAAQTLLRGEPVLEHSPNPASSPCFLDHDGFPADLQTCLYLPLLAEDHLEDILCLCDRTPTALEQGQATFFKAVAQIVGSSMRKARLYERLCAQHRQLLALSRQEAEIRQNERERLARNLHDQTSQSLTALLVGLRLLQAGENTPQTWAEKVVPLERMVDEMMENLHRLVEDLRPVSLEQLGLVGALREYITRFGQRHGISIAFDADQFDDAHLSPAVEITFYHAVREMATNVAKHAQATRVDLLLMQRDGRIIAIIEDDGIGFDPAAAEDSAHHGLVGMRERAAILGGTLTIESTLGQGTTVYLEVPDVDPNTDRG